MSTVDDLLRLYVKYRNDYYKQSMTSSHGAKRALVVKKLRLKTIRCILHDRLSLGLTNRVIYGISNF